MLSFQTMHSACGRLQLALARPGGDRVMLAVLALYTLFWTLYAVIAKGGQDAHPDMAEIVTWAREPALGYFKHPPLAAWLVKAWFAVLPVADWSYYLLAALMPSTGLWLVWRLSADYLDTGKRIAAVAILTLVPFYGALALKFNVNTMLIPLWAGTTLCFLRSYETRDIGWAALAGLCAAAAMLTKYWSIVLIAGLVIAGLADRRRALYFRSPAPWITIAAGAALLAPHVAWLVPNDFPSLYYVGAAHPPSSFAAAAKSAGAYLLGSLGYAALPLIVVFVAARPSRAALRAMLRPPQDPLRLVALAFWTPLLLLPVLAAVLFKVEITSLWSMSAWMLLPVILFAPPAVALSRPVVTKIVAAAIAFPLVMLLVSPLVAMAVQLRGLPADQLHASLLAPSVERLWRETTPAPLRIVGGDVAFGVAFYLPGAALAFPHFDTTGATWMDDARARRDGMAMVCRVSDADCIAKAEQRAAQAGGVRQRDVTVARRQFGMDGKPESYRLWALPPR